MGTFVKRASGESFCPSTVLYSSSILYSSTLSNPCLSGHPHRYLSRSKFWGIVLGTLITVNSLGETVNRYFPKYDIKHALYKAHFPHFFVYSISLRSPMPKQKSLARQSKKIREQEFWDSRF